jgi:Uma2 family endonuclease
MAAETGFVLARDPDTVRAADVAFVSRDRVPPEGVPVGFWPMAPDLAVEVVSPNDRPEDIQEKVEEYLAAGTKLVGVVYPKTQSVTVYRSLREIVVLREDDLITGDEVLPGFACPVRKLLE